MSKKAAPKLTPAEAQEQADLEKFAAADDKKAAVETVESEPVAEPLYEPEPFVITADESPIPVYTSRPAVGDFRVLIAVVDDQGAVKWVDFTMGPNARANITERSMYERYFYPALLRLAQV